MKQIVLLTCRSSAERWGHFWGYETLRLKGGPGFFFPSQVLLRSCALQVLNICTIHQILLGSTCVRTYGHWWSQEATDSLNMASPFGRLAYGLCHCLLKQLVSDVHRARACQARLAHILQCPCWPPAEGFCAAICLCRRLRCHNGRWL